MGTAVLGSTEKVSGLKPVRAERGRRRKEQKLPAAVRSVLEGRNRIRCGMDRANSDPGLVRVKQRVAIHSHPVFRARNRVRGNSAQVLPGNQIIQRLRRGLFVPGVVVDRIVHHPEVGLQHCFTRTKYRISIMDARNRCEHQDDRHYDHQLDQRKPALNRFAPSESRLVMSKISHSILRKNHRFRYQSEYFVPSIAVPVDFE
jgi:hypothetical protein